MVIKRRLIALILTVMVLAINNAFTVASPFQAIPSGFVQVDSSAGVTLYKQNYSNGYSHYVQVINLNEGAGLKLFTGTVTDPGFGTGSYSGDNPKIRREPLATSYNNFKSSNPTAVSTVNGQFFSTSNDPTSLAFPIKSPELVATGYGETEFSNPNQKLMLEIWPNKANITSFNIDSFRASSAPNILVGLTEDANKRINNYIGRTFIGVGNYNSSVGGYDKVFIFSSAYSTQLNAASILRSFGAAQVIMFDGGASSQMIWKDISYVSSSRSLPQSIGVFSSTNLITILAPSDVRGSSSAKEIFLMWVNNTANTGVEVYLKSPDAATFTLAANCSPNTSNITLGNLKPSTSYQIKLRAYNSNGYSSFTSPITVTTLNAPPKAFFANTSFTFPTTKLGLSSNGFVQIYNTGGGQLNIPNVEKISGSSDFSYIGSIPLTIGTNPNYANFNFSFTPSSTGSKSAVFRVYTNDLTLPYQDVVVYGFGSN